MRNLTISLIIPAYNEEKYIGECLKYVIKNSNNKFLEIIVVDNASTDKTAEIAKSFPGVKVIYEPQKGLTRARQCGYKNAEGEILAFIDADTHMPPKMYDNIAEEFMENSNLASISGPCVYYDFSKFHNFFVKIVYWYIMAMPAYWMIGYMVSGFNFAIRKDVLDKMGGFDTSIEFYGEDTDIARRANIYGKVKFKPNFVMHLSGRRMANQGFFKTAFIYIINFASEIFFTKPMTKKYEDYR